MTCHFKCEPYCLEFIDNCTECIRYKHRPMIWICSGYWRQQSVGFGQNKRIITTLSTSLKYILFSYHFVRQVLLHFLFQYCNLQTERVLVRCSHSQMHLALVHYETSTSITACENETFIGAGCLWTTSRHVSGVSFPLTEETETFQHYVWVLKLSGLLPRQSNVATAHILSSFFYWTGLRTPTMRATGRTPCSIIQNYEL